MFFSIFKSLQLSSIVQWPSGLGYARRRMNYFISLQYYTEYRTKMIIFLAAYVTVRYNFLLFNPISPSIALLLQYFKYNSILSIIAGIFSIINSMIWFPFIWRAIACIDNRLPPLMRSYVLLIVFLYAALVVSYYIYILLDYMLH
jgi:hypothetical protein